MTTTSSPAQLAFEQITVIGAGTMGHGIAQVCAQGGLPRHDTCRTALTTHTDCGHVAGMWAVASVAVSGVVAGGFSGFRWRFRFFVFRHL